MVPCVSTECMEMWIIKAQLWNVLLAIAYFKRGRIGSDIHAEIYNKHNFHLHI